MKKLLFTLCIFCVVNSLVIPQWIIKNTTSPGWSNAYGISALDDKIAIIHVTRKTSTGYDLLLTEDGGDTWKGIRSPYSDSLKYFWAPGISMKDRNHIWLATSDGEIFATNDRGKSWQLQFYDTTKTKSFSYLKFFDLNNGIAMGDCLSESTPAIFLRTTNGGITWQSMNTSYLIGYLSGSCGRFIDFVNENVGYFFAYKRLPNAASPQKMYKTTNGGKSWSLTNYPTFVNVFKFYNENYGISFAGNNYLITTDGGNSWKNFPSSFDLFCGDFEILKNNPNQIWAMTWTKLNISSDSCKTWNGNINLVRPRDLCFVDNNIGWILCDMGIVLRTNNNGQYPTDLKNSETEINQDFCLEQNYPNPFNPETTISWQLPIDDHVTLKIYDSLGKEIYVLVDEDQKAGLHRINFNINALKNISTTKNQTRISMSSGIYYYKLQTGNYSETKKMVFLK